MSDSRELDYHKHQIDAVYQANAYYERLALIDGGTVGLVVSVVLNTHSNLKHHYTLATGLACLIVGMVCLMARNFIIIRNQSLRIQAQYMVNSQVNYIVRKNAWRSQMAEIGGVLTSIAGITLLAIVLVLNVI
jgi:hypothetical protein